MTSNVAPFLVAVIITFPLMTSASGHAVLAEYIYTDLPSSSKQLIALIIQNTGVTPEIGLMNEEGGFIQYVISRALIVDTVNGYGGSNSDFASPAFRKPTWG